ncbi:MAG TPA: lactate utilization protein [Candidatus Methanomethylia archaeon]|nr:lactate utilization protein [Candidatus Methanomethylicia archaeon]
MSWFDESRELLISALKDTARRTALARAVEAYTSAKYSVLPSIPDLDELSQQVRKVKEKAVQMLEELAKQAKESIERASGHAYIARTAEEALKIAEQIIGSGKTIVKSKSLTAEEIKLRKFLEAKGNRVIETDLGEFIVQLRGETPTHIVNPAIHVPREAVAELFSKMVGRRLPSNIPHLVATARELLREEFFRAEVGVSGANVIAADTGTIFILENEGNARFVTNAPPVHVCIAGFEKVVPSIRDAFNVVRLLPPYATGIMMAGYVSMITGPSKTADIEKTVAYGVHGPKELHVILLDNGRIEMAKHPVLREALYCIRCGGCLYECRIYRILDGFFGANYFAGIGVPWVMYTRSPQEAAFFAYACTTCGRCRELCPLRIDIPSIVEACRAILREKGFTVPRHMQLAENFLKELNPYGEPKNKRASWLQQSESMRKGF